MLEASARRPTYDYTVTQIMRPKGKLLALVAMFAAVGLITATGAFTTVEAQRTADVQVSGDASALLGLSEPADMPAGSVDGATNGQATIDLTNTGVNPNAQTELAPLLNVSNNGNDNVTLNVTATSDTSGVTVEAIDTDGNTFGNSVSLTSGQTTQFGLSIDIDDSVTDQQITIDISIEANSS